MTLLQNSKTLILLLGLNCIFSHHCHPTPDRVCQMFWSKYAACFHYSLDLLYSSFLVPAPLKAGGLQCFLVYGPEQDSQVWNMWPPKPTRHCTFFFVIGNARCGSVSLLQRGCAPTLKNVHLVFLVLAFGFPESFTEVACP